MFLKFEINPSFFEEYAHCIPFQSLLPFTFLLLFFCHCSPPSIPLFLFPANLPASLMLKISSLNLNDLSSLYFYFWFLTCLQVRALRRIELQETQKIFSHEKEARKILNYIQLQIFQAFIFSSPICLGLHSSFLTIAAEHTYYAQTLAICKVTK